MLMVITNNGNVMYAVGVWSPFGMIRFGVYFTLLTRYSKREKMSKQITQDTFDDVVKENMEDFDMSAEEAIEDAVQQFEAQVRLELMRTNMI